MKCEIFRNGNKIMGPVEYNRDSIRDVIVRQGANGALLPSILTKMVTIATIQIKPVREVKPNLTPEQKYTDYTRRESTDEVIYDYNVANKTPEEMKEKILSRLSVIHDTYEAQRFEYQGVMIKADLEARINAESSLNLFGMGLVNAIEWRGKIKDETTLDLGGIQNDSAWATGTIAVNGLDEMKALYGSIVGYLTKGFAARSAVESILPTLTRPQLAVFDVQGKFNEAVNA